MMENVKVKRSSILMSIHTRNLYTIYNEVERNVSSLYRTKKKISNPFMCMLTSSYVGVGTTSVDINYEGDKLHWAGF